MVVQDFSTIPQYVTIRYPFSTPIHEKKIQDTHSSNMTTQSPFFLGIGHINFPLKKVTELGYIAHDIG
jgi:hypothetical protein